MLGRVTSLLVEIVLALVVALPAHEAGHYLAARLLGAQDVSLVRTGALSAAVRASFPADRRAARMAFFAAGALANGALALALHACGLHVVAGIQWVFALLMLVPTKDSDGRRLLSLVVGKG